MGYESRVIIARKNSISPKFIDVVAELNMSGVTDGFLNLFKDEYTGLFFDFYARGEDRQIKVDKYDKPLTYAPFDKVYKWLLDNVLEEHYRRYDMLLAVLNTVRTGWATQENEFIVIHYGY